MMVRSRVPEAESIARKLVVPFQPPDFALELGASSLKVRSTSTDSRRSIPLFFLTKRGEVRFWPKAFARRAGAAGVDAAISDEFAAAMRQLLAKVSGDDCRARALDVDIQSLQGLVLEFHRKAVTKRN